MYHGDIEILRIGDSLKEELKIPSEFKKQIKSVKKYCTKPELEILLIINKKLMNDFNKVKSKEKPKMFAKKNITIGKQKYDNSTRFYEIFYNDVEELVNDIKEYKKISRNNKNELYLADLLK